MKSMARAVALFAFLFSAMAQAQETPDALVKKTVDDVLSTIKQTKDQRQLIEIAEQKVLPHFDFRQMTRLAVGRSWSEASKPQQEALERGFRTLLVRTYTAALSQSSGDIKVDVKPAAVQGEDATVKTVAVASGKQPVQIDYRMAKTAAGWKVYDVSVENLSLVTTYRTSFQSEIGRSGIDGLIKTIEARNQKTAAG